MAAREETRDEIDVRTLRELASLPCNKYCFDCGQRGPTYVNVTIGAFVCSACGGLLRGLNPPHRVKSLTVCSFTEVEMDKIKSRGNEYCTHIWLGKCDPNTIEKDLSSVEKRREFMIQKYEDKVYYVDPKEAIKRMKPRAPAVPRTSASSVSQSRSHTIIPNRQAIQLQRPGFMSQTFTNPQAVKNVPDLFKELENDPFKNLSPRDGSGESVSFADFGSAFGDSGSVTTPPQSQTVVSSNSAFSPSSLANASMVAASHKKPAPPPPDRYAALADLDSQLNPQAADVATHPVPAAPVAAANVATFWAANTPAMAAGVYSSVAQNPFNDANNSSWAQQAMVPPVSIFQPLPQPRAAGNATCLLPPQNANGLPNANNTMPSLLNGAMPGLVWPSVPNKSWGMPFQNGQADVFQCQSSTAVDNHDPWAQSYVSSSVNPFLNGSGSSGQQATQQTSAGTNPFL